MHSDFHIGKWAGMSGAFGAVAVAQWMDLPAFPLWVLAIMAVAAGAVAMWKVFRPSPPPSPSAASPRS